MRKRKKLIPKKAIMYGSMIESILKQYDQDELTYTAASMKFNIALMMKSAMMTNPKKYRTAVMQSQEIWNDTFKHFEHRKKIEIIRIVAVLYDKSSSEMANLCHITDKMIDRFDQEGMFESSAPLSVQEGSMEVGYFIIDRVREVLGKQPRENRLAGLKAKLNNDNKKRLEK